MTTPNPTMPISARSLCRLSPWRRRRGAALLLPALATLAASCGGNGAATRGQPPPVPVTVAQVVQKTVPVSFRAIGHVEPIATVAIKARIGGELLKVSFTEGQNVAAGATLFAIDPRPYEAALAQAEAGLARNRALLAKADADAARYAGLVTQDYVTKEQYDQIVANAAALRATLAADQASVDNARLNLGYCTITAPVRGRTGALSVKTGNLVKANDDQPLVTINQTRPIYVAFPVPAQFLPALTSRREDGIRVTATLPGGEAATQEGVLSFIDNAVDPGSGTILLKATFPNQEEALWPGQFVDVTVVLGEEPNRVVAPAPAVQTGQQGLYVFVIKDDDTAEMRPVQVARIDDKEAVIASGLTAGETVVTDGQLRLIPGARVAVKTGAGSGEKQP
jgi:multidrug efflux system membrane fusion protein